MVILSFQSNRIAIVRSNTKNDNVNTALIVAYINRVVLVPLVKRSVQKLEYYGELQVGQYFVPPSLKTDKGQSNAQEFLEYSY